MTNHNIKDSIQPIGPQRANSLVQTLLHWYEASKRDLPWRLTKDPYAIWVSEIMAQQTRITALLPYYERFMKQFPNIQTLAQAKQEDVLKAWEGLGYYSRARNLQKAAQLIVQTFDGQFPFTEKELRSLPGIGEYTAGAILSMAFQQPVPAVDGNVLRIVARLENSALDITLPAAKTMTSQYVQRLIPPDRPGCFNQALMDLGALICLPKGPACSSCPLHSLCHAYSQGRQHILPVKSPKKAAKPVDKTVLILYNPQGEILVRQRTESLLHKLWEFYLLDANMDLPQVKQHIKDLGYTINQVTAIGQATHVFTHLIWSMHGYACAIEESQPIGDYQFLNKATLQTKAMPTALRFYTHWLAQQTMPEGL